MKGTETVSAPTPPNGGGLNPPSSQNIGGADPGASVGLPGVNLPNLAGLASTIHGLVEGGLTIDEAAQKVAAFVDPSLVPALKTLADVLTAVAKFV